jgi:hypothetical protein
VSRMASTFFLFDHVALAVRPPLVLDIGNPIRVDDVSVS